MTLMGLQTGFADMRGAETMAAVRAIGCQMCRISLNRSHDDAKPFERVPHKIARALIDEVRQAGMEPLVIVRDADQIKKDVPRGVRVGFGNEPEDAIFGWRDQAHYIAEAWRAIKAADGRNELGIGVVANLRVTFPGPKAAGLTWLQQLPWKEIPSWVTCEHHWYPDDNWPHDSHIKRYVIGGPWQPRDRDIEMLRAIVGHERPLGLSETGWWDRPAYVDPDTGAGVAARTEAEVSAWYAVEREVWQKHNYVFAIAYQIDSGAPPENPKDWGPGNGYGFRELGSVDGWKDRARAWFGEVA